MLPRTLIAGLIALTLTTEGSQEGEGSPGEGAGEPELRADLGDWLEEVALLIGETERQVFLSLAADYQRQHFITKFWRTRDPFPQTARNEFRDYWEERIERARALFGSIDGERAKMLLTVGEPTKRRPSSCAELLRPLEIWTYAKGSERIRGFFTLIFYPTGSRKGPHRLWQPNDGLSALVLFSRGGSRSDVQLALEIASTCSRGDDLVSIFAQSLDTSRIGPLVPVPNEEWALAFKGRTTEVAADAEPLAAAIEMSFPGRNQSRTVVQGLISVASGPSDGAQATTGGTFDLVVDGEVLRKKELFEQFRYRFAFPASSVGTNLPLVLQRYLRPGQYRLILKVEDMHSRRVYYADRQLDVPRVESAIATPTVTPARAATENSGSPQPSFPEPSRSLFAEANASISTGDHAITIVGVPTVLAVGKIRIDAKTRGEGIAKVAFELNDRQVMRKSRPPYSIEIDLGQQPRIHSVRAIALDGEGRALASDEITVNAGPHRFAVRLIEPQRGSRFLESCRAHAEVEIPEGEKLDRLEFYLDEQLISTLYQPPYEQPILLPSSLEMSFVRAVAHLESGISTEDVRLINAPDNGEELKIHFVELFTSVLDRRGKPVENLQRADFSVFEDGTSQEVRRFELVRDTPVHAGLLLDTSISMEGSLRKVERAALRFFETVLTPRDRAALVTFNDEPQLIVRFTNDSEILAGGLSGLTAEGETSLWDSIIFSLHYFSGLKGKRALIALTDGEDSISHYSFVDAIEFARRTGVAIYVIGLNLNSSDHETRMRLRRLSSETGGQCFLIGDINQLGKVYESVETEIRSQYLLAYQSSSKRPDDEFREVTIEMKTRGFRAKTMRGYYP